MNRKQRIYVGSLGITLFIGISWALSFIPEVGTLVQGAYLLVISIILTLLLCGVVYALGKSYDFLGD